MPAKGLSSLTQNLAFDSRHSAIYRSVCIWHALLNSKLTREEKAELFSRRNNARTVVEGGVGGGALLRRGNPFISKPTRSDAPCGLCTRYTIPRAYNTMCNNDKQYRISLSSHFPLPSQVPKGKGNGRKYLTGPALARQGEQAGRRSSRADNMQPLERWNHGETAVCKK